MIHLSYHPAFDAFHCIFRFLRIKSREQLTEIEFDKLRILDYYLLFPWRASAIRLPQKDIFIRKVAKNLEVKQDYATLPTGEILLERMRASQMAALQTLADDKFIDIKKLQNNIVCFGEKVIPVELEKRISEINLQENDRMQIIDALSSYPLLGMDGLKGRTSLLECRYDRI